MASTSLTQRLRRLLKLSQPHIHICCVDIAIGVWSALCSHHKAFRQMRFAHTGTLTHTQTNSQTNSLCSMFLCVVFFCVCESSTARETCVGVGKLALRRRSSAHCPNQFSEPVFGLTYFFVHDSCKSHHRHVSFILWAPMTSSCSKNGDELVLSFCTHTKHHLTVFIY